MEWNGMGGNGREWEGYMRTFEILGILEGVRRIRKREI